MNRILFATCYRRWFNTPSFRSHANELHAFRNALRSKNDFEITSMWRDHGPRWMDALPMQERTRLLRSVSMTDQLSIGREVFESTLAQWEGDADDPLQQDALEEQYVLMTRMLIRQGHLPEALALTESTFDSSVTSGTSGVASDSSFDSSVTSRTSDAPSDNNKLHRKLMRCVVEEYARQGNVDQVAQLIQCTFPKHREPDWALACQLQALYQSNRFQDASDFFEFQLTHGASSVPLFETMIQGLSALSGGHGLHRAESLLRRMSAMYLRPTYAIYDALVRGAMAMPQNVPLARQVLSEMRQAMMQPDDALSSHLVHRYYRMKLPNEGDRTLAQWLNQKGYDQGPHAVCMHLQALQPDDRQNAYLLNSLCLYACTHNLKQSVLDLAEHYGQLQLDPSQMACEHMVDYFTAQSLRPVYAVRFLLKRMETEQMTSNGAAKRRRSKDARGPAVVHVRPSLMQRVAAVYRVLERYPDEALRQQVDGSVDALVDAYRSAVKAEVGEHGRVAVKLGPVLAFRQRSRQQDIQQEQERKEVVAAVSH